jgi:hypothetical protein
LVPNGISVANAAMTGFKTLLDDEAVHKRHQLNRESDDSFHMEECGSVFRKVGQMDAYAHLSIRRQVTGMMFFLYVTGMAQPFKPVRASTSLCTCCS